MTDTVKYKRVLLKLSGEALQAKDGIIDFVFLGKVAKVIKETAEKGASFAFVIGGGNIWRGAKGVEVERSRSDHMGMLATTINSLAFQDALIKEGMDARVMTALDMQKIAESYSQDRANRYLDKGKPVIIACGTGNPYFSTDTGAILRAAELKADVALFAKNVDAVYDSDPKLNKDAKRIACITYKELIDKGLKVIDISAAAIASEANIKTLIFALKQPGNIYNAVMGKDIGTVINA